MSLGNKKAISAHEESYVFAIARKPHTPCGHAAKGSHHLVTLTGSATNSAHRKSYASVTMRKRIDASSRSQGVALG